MIEIILQAERAMAVGMLDQAERLYHQAADLDPRNSIAVVGLARVALDRGDDRRALELTRSALTIDPENAAAQRLAERLEEVMRYRGEEPPATVATATPATPAAEPARTVEAGPAAEPASDPITAVEPVSTAEPVTVPEPATATEASPAAPADRPPEPAPARRSLLDRLRRRR